MIWKVKVMICAAALLTAAVVTEAAEKAAPAERKGKNAPWEFVQPAIWYGLGSNQNDAAAVGIRVGLPVCGGTAPVYGIDLGILGAASNEVYGFQFGVCAGVSKKINGLTIGLVTATDTAAGVQIGVVNTAKTQSFQLGLINYIEDGWLPFFPIINFKF